MAYTGRILHYFIRSVFLCHFILKRTFFVGLGVGCFTFSSVLDWNSIKFLAHNAGEFLSEVILIN